MLFLKESQMGTPGVIISYRTVQNFSGTLVVLLSICFYYYSYFISLINISVSIGNMNHILYF